MSHLAWFFRDFEFAGLSFWSDKTKRFLRTTSTTPARRCAQTLCCSAICLSSLTRIPSSSHFFFCLFLTLPTKVYWCRTPIDFFFFFFSFRHSPNRRQPRPALAAIFFLFISSSSSHRNPGIGTTGLQLAFFSPPQAPFIPGLTVILLFVAPVVFPRVCSLCLTLMATHGPASLARCTSAPPKVSLKLVSWQQAKTQAGKLPATSHRRHQHPKDSSSSDNSNDDSSSNRGTGRDSSDEQTDRAKQNTLLAGGIPTLARTMPAGSSAHFALERQGYTLHETIGCGGYSKVKLATQQSSGQKVGSLISHQDLGSCKSHSPRLFVFSTGGSKNHHQELRTLWLPKEILAARSASLAGAQSRSHCKLFDFGLFLFPSSKVSF